MTGTPCDHGLQKGTTAMVTPEYGWEELGTQRSERAEERDEGLTPDEYEDAPEREIREEDYEKRERRYLDAEDNEARAPGQVCGRCGKVILAGQDARLRNDGWVHDVCPVDAGDSPD